jgi:thiamine kinase-like enzyme
VGDDIGSDSSVEALARRVPGWADAELTIEPVELGITNRNYKVTLSTGRAYMLRLPGERTEVLGIDRANEAEAARRADELGIGPPVLGELPGVGTLVTEFVGGRHAADDAEFAARLPEVVDALRRFHRSGSIGGAFPIHRVVEWHARDAATRGVPPPAAFDELHQRSTAIESAFAAAPTPPVPCHNDLLPANVLFDQGRVWLLDFEYAGMNDVFFDLGNLAVNSALDAPAQEALLVAYFGAVTPSRWARLQLMTIMSELREGMWAVVQQAISTLTHVDFVAYADERLGNCTRLCATPDFGRWLTDAAAPV